MSWQDYKIVIEHLAQSPFLPLVTLCCKQVYDVRSVSWQVREREVLSMETENHSVASQNCPFLFAAQNLQTNDDQLKLSPTGLTRPSAWSSNSETLEIFGYPGWEETCHGWCGFLSLLRHLRVQQEIATKMSPSRLRFQNFPFRTHRPRKLKVIVVATQKKRNKGTKAADVSFVVLWQDKICHLRLWTFVTAFKR